MVLIVVPPPSVYLHAITCVGTHMVVTRHLHPPISLSDGDASLAERRAAIHLGDPRTSWPRGCPSGPARALPVSASSDGPVTRYLWRARRARPFRARRRLRHTSAAGQGRP